MSCPLLLLDLTTGVHPCQFSSTNVSEADRGVDALLGDLMDFEMLGHRGCFSFNNPKLLKTNQGWGFFEKVISSNI